MVSISRMGSANMRMPSSVVRSVSSTGKSMHWLNGMPGVAMRPQAIWIRLPSEAGMFVLVEVTDQGLGGGDKAAAALADLTGDITADVRLATVVLVAVCM